MCELPKDSSAEWYTKAAVRRGIDSVVQIIADGQEALEKDGDKVPVSIRRSLEGMLAYHEQMLREMRQYIPKELQG